MFNKNHVNNIIVANASTNAATQVWNPSVAGYLAPGNVVVTGVDGTIWDGTGTVPEEIIIQWANPTGKKVQTKAIKRSEVKSYFTKAYVAPVEKVIDLTVTQTPVVGVTYMLKFRINGYSCNHFGGLPLQKTIAFTAATTVVADLAAGLRAAATLAFTDDQMWQIAVTGATTHVILTAKALTFEVGKFEFSQLDFLVEPVNFTGTQAVTNLNPGSGHYKKVAQMEYEGRQDYGVVPLVTAHIPPSAIQLNAQSGCTYNCVIINWEKEQGSFSKDTLLKGSITAYCDTAAANGTELKAILGAFLTGVAII